MQKDGSVHNWVKVEIRLLSGLSTQNVRSYLIRQLKTDHDLDLIFAIQLIV